MASPAQSMRDVYHLNFLEYQKLGDHPKIVARFGVDVGRTVNRELDEGKFPDLTNREQILAGLNGIYGSPARTREELMQLIEDGLRAGSEDRMAGNEIPDSLIRLVDQAAKTFEVLGHEFAQQRVLQQLEDRKIRDMFNSHGNDDLFEHVRLKVFLPLLDYLGIAQPLTKDAPEVRQFVVKELRARSMAIQARNLRNTFSS